MEYSLYMHEIIIETTDKNLLDDLRKENISDLAIIYWDNMLKAENSYAKEIILAFTIGFLSSTASSCFIDWIKKRCNERPQCQTKIIIKKVEKTINFNINNSKINNLIITVDKENNEDD